MSQHPEEQANIVRPPTKWLRAPIVVSVIILFEWFGGQCGKHWHCHACMACMHTCQYMYCPTPDCKCPSVCCLPFLWFQMWSRQMQNEGFVWWMIVLHLYCYSCTTWLTANIKLCCLSFICFQMWSRSITGGSRRHLGHDPTFRPVAYLPCPQMTKLKK